MRNYMTRMRKTHQRRIENGHAPVPAKKAIRFDRKLLAEIMVVIGYKATKALMNGGNLHIWRNSSPHNWWVSPKNDEHNYLWHSDDQSYARELPPLKAFCGVSEEGVVSYGNNFMFAGASDAGMAQWSKYVINPKLRAVWDRMTPEMRRSINKKTKWETNIK